MIPLDNIQLLIIGEGPLKNQLINEVNYLNISKYIKFAGFIENQKILLNKLKESDIFLLSSKNEGFPRVMYESMAMGIPIVTTNAGGIPYLLKNKVDALIVPIGDHKSLSKGCIEIINNKILRKRLIENGRNKVEKILKETDSNQISNLIRDLI